MATAAFTTLGCKVNQYETDRMAERFEAHGFVIGAPSGAADVYVINTCSVTQVAEHKSRKLIRRLARLHPDAVIVVTGCQAEMARIRGDETPASVLLVPNREKLSTLEWLVRQYPRFAVLEQGEQTARGVGSVRTRATIKVQDGCDIRCSFCSIPSTRGAPVSRLADEIVSEVERAAVAGHAEVVVTGVLVGSYGAETGSGGPDLAELLRRVAGVAGIERVRLSSIEPTQVSPELLDVFATNPRVCPHLHLPLQSGDTSVLAAMNRPYTRTQYLSLCETAFAMVRDLAITTDIMVGFPGETDEQHANTIDVVRRVGFARSHVFRFSPREGTPAWCMRPAVLGAVKDRRASEMTGACRAAQQRFVAHRIGEVVSVLVEEKPDRRGLFSGYTPNYIRTAFPCGAGQIGRVVSVRLTATDGDGAIGEVVSLS